MMKGDVLVGVGLQMVHSLLLIPVQVVPVQVGLEQVVHVVMVLQAEGQSAVGHLL